jgi:3-hydroxyisobutyrate dehydrogenase-like beta-hydroxyacid dehydrogenase
MVGVGNMGGPMAGHLVAAGFAVAAFDVATVRMDALQQRGARAAASPADAAQGTDLVGIVVMDDTQVEAVTLGP